MVKEHRVEDPAVLNIWGSPQWKQLRTATSPRPESQRHRQERKVKERKEAKAKELAQRAEDRSRVDERAARMQALRDQLTEGENEIAAEAAKASAGGSVPSRGMKRKSTAASPVRSGKNVKIVPAVRSVQIKRYNVGEASSSKHKDADVCQNHCSGVSGQ